MKKKLITILSVIVILFGILLLFFPNIPNDLSLVLSSGPPSPKSDVPITYSIGWWNNQNQVSITKLEATIVESKLSLFNNKSLFQYSIFGKLCNPKGRWKPQISQAHFSERYIQYDFEKEDSINRKKYIGEIHITPIVENVEDNSYKGDTLTFSINLQEIVESANWGECMYIIKCSDISDTLVIHQYK